MKELLAGLLIAGLISWYDIANTPPDHYLSPVPDHPLQEVQVEDEVDPMAKRIEAFLDHYRSPLAEHADFIVAISHTYGIDPRLLVSIAGVESTFCKFIPAHSFNCFGWGIYHGKVTRFPNYKFGVQEVARGLSRPPYKGKTYQEFAGTYSESKDWAQKVEYFYERI